MPDFGMKYCICGSPMLGYERSTTRSYIIQHLNPDRELEIDHETMLGTPESIQSLVLKWMQDDLHKEDYEEIQKRNGDRIVYRFPDSDNV